MKNIIAILFVLISISLSGQTINKEIKNLKSNTLKIHSGSYDVNVKTWDKSYISVTAIVESSHPESINKMDIITKNSNDNIHIDGILEFDNKKRKNCVSTKSNLVLFVPKDMVLKLDAEFGDVLVKGDYKNYKIDCRYGDLNITANDESLNNSDFDIEYGDINIIVSDESDVAFCVNTKYGDVYTDLDLYRSKNNQYKLNNGKNVVRIDAKYGDIQLRSK